MDNTIILTALKGPPHTLIKANKQDNTDTNWYKVTSFTGSEKMGFTDTLCKYITLKGGPTLTINSRIRGTDLFVEDIQIIYNKGLFVALKKEEK